MSFFYPAIDHGVKRKMVKGLKNPGLNEPPKCIQMQVSGIDSKQLEDFVIVSTLNFFEIFELPSKFLTLIDTEQWEENEDFQEAKHCAQSLRVVNDNAEPGVKLIQLRIQLIYQQNEEQKQCLLRVVSVYLSTELSSLRQRSLCYFRDSNNLKL